MIHCSSWDPVIMQDLAKSDYGAHALRFRWIPHKSGPTAGGPTTAHIPPLKRLSLSGDLSRLSLSHWLFSMKRHKPQFVEQCSISVITGIGCG